MPERLFSARNTPPALQQQSISDNTRPNHPQIDTDPTGHTNNKKLSAAILITRFSRIHLRYAVPLNAIIVYDAFGNKFDFSITYISRQKKKMVFFLRPDNCSLFFINNIGFFFFYISKTNTVYITRSYSRIVITVILLLSP